MMTDKYIVDLTDVTYSTLLDTSVLEVQRVASGTQTEKINLDFVRKYITGAGPYKSGWYYMMHPFATYGTGAAALVANSVRAFPFYIRAPVTITSVVVRITTGAAGGNIQAAIYAHDYSSGQPTGSELGKTASQTTASTGIFEMALLANATLQPGTYWFCVNSDNATVQCAIPTGGAAITGGLVGSSAVLNIWNSATNLSCVFSTPVTFGTWGDLTGATWTQGQGFNFAGGAFKVA